jgi:hypothetical protein
MAKCLNCGLEFEAKRGTAKFCSNRCRKLAFQRKSKVSVPAVLSVLGITVPENGKVSVSVVSVPGFKVGDINEPELPANFGQPDCECRHCQQNRRSDHKLIINHGAWKPASQLAANEVNRVSLPGDVDYVGICTPQQSMEHCHA